MKTSKLIAITAAGLMLGASAHAADIVVHFSGSTAFRSAVLSLLNNASTNNPFDAGTITTQGDSAAGKALPGAVFRGTMTNHFGAGQYVQLRFNFTGSANGISDVVNGHALPYHTWDGTTHGTNNVAPDVAFADTYSDSNPTPIDPTTLDDAIVGAPVFAFIRSKDAFTGCTVSGITNMTRLAYQALTTFNGPGGMTDTYLGGHSNAPIYLIGRDGGSGTRITNDRNTGNTAGQNLWFYYYSGSSVYYGTNVNLANNTYGPAGTQNDGNTRGVGPGFLSGGDVGTTVANSPSSIGYVGLSDNKGAQILLFNGTGIYGIDASGSVTAPLSRMAESGAYEYWSYEHMYNNTSLGANQKTVRDLLIAGIKNADFQNTTGYANNNARLAAMQVDRGGDGGTITIGSASGIKF